MPPSQPCHIINWNPCHVHFLFWTQLDFLATLSFIGPIQLAKCTLVSFFNMVQDKKKSLCFVVFDRNDFTQHIMKHPSYRYPAKFAYVLLYSHYLFGKKLIYMQDKLVNKKTKKRTF